MKILKPGKVEMRKFVCPECGCEFLAEHHDRRARGTYALGVEFVCDCPTCCTKVLWCDGEPYEEPTQTDRERLLRLLQEARTKHLTKEVVDYLIANGVTFREG